MPDERELQPGEYDAVMKGCVCTVRDGEPVDNANWSAWLVRGCPLHDPEFDVMIQPLRPKSSLF